MAAPAHVPAHFVESHVIATATPTAAHAADAGMPAAVGIPADAGISANAAAEDAPDRAPHDHGVAAGGEPAAIPLGDDPFADSLALSSALAEMDSVEGSVSSGVNTDDLWGGAPESDAATTDEGPVGVDATGVAPAAEHWPGGEGLGDAEPLEDSAGGFGADLAPAVTQIEPAADGAPSVHRADLPEQELSESSVVAAPPLIESAVVSYVPPPDFSYGAGTGVEGETYFSPPAPSLEGSSEDEVPLDWASEPFAHPVAPIEAAAEGHVAEPASPGTEHVEPLPFDAGDALAAEPLVPIRPELVSSGFPEIEQTPHSHDPAIDELEDLPDDLFELDSIDESEQAPFIPAEATPSVEPLHPIAEPEQPMAAAPVPEPVALPTRLAATVTVLPGRPGAGPTLTYGGVTAAPAPAEASVSAAVPPQFAPAAQSVPEPQAALAPRPPRRRKPLRRLSRRRLRPRRRRTRSLAWAAIRRALSAGCRWRFRRSRRPSFRSAR